MKEGKETLSHWASAELTCAAAPPFSIAIFERGVARDACDDAREGMGILSCLALRLAPAEDPEGIIWKAMRGMKKGKPSAC